VIISTFEAEIDTFFKILEYNNSAANIFGVKVFVKQIEES